MGNTAVKLMCNVCWFLLDIPPPPRGVLAMLHAHGIHAEECLHCPRGSDESGRPLSWFPWKIILAPQPLQIQLYRC